MNQEPLSPRLEALAVQFPDTKKNLEILSEEAAEVIQAKSKLIRFGLDHRHPGNGRLALHLLEDEIGDFFAAVDILIASRHLDFDRLIEARDRKIEKLALWYGDANPTLTP